MKVDLTDDAATAAAFAAARPAGVVHCAAERRPDVAQSDPELVKRINVEAARRLARLAAAAGAWLVYVSTDYVFDGARPPYEISDAPRPINFYGVTKLAGEHAVQEEHPSAAILRVPVLCVRAFRSTNQGRIN
ncbi:hypothetical protein HK405_001329 [Cladochytrium tenue]|nr:hypothetical protein HK405_001329 [Cladochytrium tenue]